MKKAMKMMKKKKLISSPLGPHFDLWEDEKMKKEDWRSWEREREGKEGKREEGK